MALEEDESLNELVNSYIDREADLQAQIQNQSEHLSAQRETIAALEEETLMLGEAQTRQDVRQEQRRDSLGTMARLAAAAQPNVGMTSEIVAQQGAALAAAHIENFEQHRGKVVELFRQPGWSDNLEKAVDTGNPALVAGVIGSAVATLAASDKLEFRQHTRAMKLNAQGITGGQSGRPDNRSDDEQRWQRIHNAGQSDYAAYARAEGR